MVVSTPGKLILMGEHAVVYGHPALITSLGLRLRVRLRSAAHEDVALHLTESGHQELVRWGEITDVTDDARRDWLRYATASAPGGFRPPASDDPAYLVKVALGEVRAFLGERRSPGIELEVSSGIPLGSGFGSSAALALAVVDGYLAFRGVSPSAAELRALALEVERRQHGRPSGVDGATELRGGVMWAERDEGGDLLLEPLVARGPHLSGFRVYQTGRPGAPTGAVVGAVRERWNREREVIDPLLDEMGETTRRFRGALVSPGGSAAEIVALVRRFEARLESLGVVPPWVQDIVREVEAHGGAAKISGAGTLINGALARPDGGLETDGFAEVDTRAESPGTGAGGLLVFHPEPDRIADWACLEDLEPVPVRLSATGGMPGHRREDA